MHEYCGPKGRTMRRCLGDDVDALCDDADALCDGVDALCDGVDALCDSVDAIYGDRSTRMR